MINNPDIQPNAAVNHWISAILLFDFRLRHVPGHMHGPDGLSRQPSAPEDPADNEDYEEWIDTANSFVLQPLSAGPHYSQIDEDLPHMLTTLPDNMVVPAPEPIDSCLPLKNHLVAAYPILSSSPITTIPRSKKARAKDNELKKITRFLLNPTKREEMSTDELKVLIKKASAFFVANGRL